MSHSISTLLTRNLQEVFGEKEPARRRAAVNELYTEGGVFYDPTKGVYRGRDEIQFQGSLGLCDRFIKTTHRNQVVRIP